MMESSSTRPLPGQLSFPSFDDGDREETLIELGIVSRESLIREKRELDKTVAEVVATGRVVRLGCIDCDCEDHDGITVEQLAAAVAAGWTGVEEVQSLRDSLDGNLSGGRATWETHLGYCPWCSRGEIHEGSY
jgi:hypothetical protein